MEKKIRSVYQISYELMDKKKIFNHIRDFVFSSVHNTILSHLYSTSASVQQLCRVLGGIPRTTLYGYLDDLEQLYLIYRESKGTPETVSGKGRGRVYCYIRFDLYTECKDKGLIFIAEKTPYTIHLKNPLLSC